MKAPKRQRLVMADLLIASEKSLSGSSSRTYEEIYAEAGFRSADEYWSDATSEQSGFEHRLMIHFLSPSLKDVRGYEQDLEDAKCFAAENGEPWIKEINGRKIVRRPREAAEWLLSQPTREHLIPAGLRAFLSQEPPTTAQPTKPQRLKPKRLRVEEKMRKCDPVQLDALKQKELPKLFGAGRTLCVEVRKEVLSSCRSTKKTNDT